jgi:hypothetical protein
MKRLTIISLFAALLFASIAVGLLITRPQDHSSQLAQLEQKLQRSTSEIATLKSKLSKAQSNSTAKVIPASSNNSVTPPIRVRLSHNALTDSELKRKKVRIMC